MRVLITGGTGFLGRAIVGALVARGHTPVVFGRRAATLVADGHAGVLGEAIVGDVRDRDALAAAAHGCDAMIHTAALVSVWRPRARDFDDTNVGGLRHALEAVHTHGLQRLVYTSSFLALPPAGRTAPLVANDYQRTKADAAVIAADARDHGVPIVSMYPGVIYGPGLLSEGNLVGRLIADHLAGRLPGLLGAQRLWSFAWVHEVAQAHVAALDHPNPEPGYQLGGPNLPQISPFEVLHALKGTRLPRQLPLWTGTPVAWIEEARARLTGRPPQLTRLTLEIFRHDWPMDSTAAERDLAFRQKKLEEGVAEMVPA
ncbi:MAG: NAD-dependent epimerase/dehydratase family protein [Acidobacteria bacterium]|nr:NAD-dependent epimerase/dehydratase family protein [Acidobacteriota bacterium]